MQSTVRFTAWPFVLLLAAGCSRSSVSQAHVVPAQRIVAIVPSAVDDLFAIGADSQVVAVTAFSEEPQAKGLPRVAEFNSVDTERIVALHPDAVIGIPSQSQLVAPLVRAGIRVALIPDDSFHDVFTSISAIGAIAGRTPEANALIARLRDETNRLHARTVHFARHPSVFVVLGSGPIWTVGKGSYISTLIDLAGGTNAASDLREPYGEYSAEALLRDQPDVIVSDPVVNLRAVLDREPWRSLHAVQRGHVYDIVPPEMIIRPGPSYNDGLRWLIDRLQPLAAQP